MMMNRCSCRTGQDFFCRGGWGWKGKSERNYVALSGQPSVLLCNISIMFWVLG